MREVDEVAKEKIASVNLHVLNLEMQAKRLREKTIKIYEKIEEVRKQLHSISIDCLYISNRAYNALKAYGITNIGQVIEHGRHGLMGIDRISTVTVNEIEAELAALGLDLPYMMTNVYLDENDLREGDMFAAKWNDE